MITQEKINAIVEERQVDIKWFGYAPMTNIIEDILFEDTEHQIEHLVIMDGTNCYLQMSPEWFNAHECEQDKLMELGCVKATLEGPVLTVFA